MQVYGKDRKWELCLGRHEGYVVGSCYNRHIEITLGFKNLFQICACSLVHSLSTSLWISSSYLPVRITTNVIWWLIFMVYLMAFKQETHLKMRLWDHFEKHSAGWREAQNVGSTSPWLESQTKENGEVSWTLASISLCFWTVDPRHLTISGSGRHDFLSRGTASSNCAKIDSSLTWFWFCHNHKGNWYRLWRKRLAAETQLGRYHWGRVLL